ncbi:hypothetical protein L6164_012424 [Bauhinia variegata]|uniref:Uncharacterized protein n=1 Tax=Bauhinia variegata TaxID=167791 RepID=A0ACB9PA39_BAUVA|nr:hypothetical protein L6164_012424 [Bauhinia variegata]
MGTPATSSMKCFSLVSLCFLIALCIQSASCKNISESDRQLASLPPRGWNSYDSFSWIISEEEFLQNAEIVSQRLHVHGYEYVVVDYLWYRRKVQGAYSDSLGFDVIDEWGRMIPDPVRWPSSKGGKGFTEVANKVHSMGLKFGIHVMRGISTQALNANTPILDTTKGGSYKESGRVWQAKDIAMPERACAWMPHGFMSVNTKTGAGRAFLRSLYEQYASWGVDFVKNDCVFGDDLDLNEISYVSEVLQELNRPIVYSLSPGTSVTPAMAKDVKGLVNMYRITGDDWDTWPDVAAHFDVARDFAAAGMIGAESLMGKSWPDLDMLPFGWLTDPGSNDGPHRFSRLTLEEQKSQMTLWSMAKSPLMFGGDLRKLDQTTYNLITNPTVLEINYFSSNNMDFPYIKSLKNITTQDHHLSGKRHGQTSLRHSLGLTGCTESKASASDPFCVHKRGLGIASDTKSMYQDDYRGKHHLVATNRMQFCLDASPKRKLTSKEFKRGSFSPCRMDANQMWELNSNGTLVNSYSGLCATVESIEDTSNSGGIRAWVATGRKGEIYLAFFNLDAVKTVISAKTSDLAKVLPSRNLNSCKSTEIWSGKELQITQGTVSAAVEKHGSALIVLNCN